MRKYLAVGLVIVVTAMGLVMALRRERQQAPPATPGSPTQSVSSETGAAASRAAATAEVPRQRAAPPKPGAAADSRAEAPAPSEPMKETGPGIVRGLVMYPDGRNASGATVRVVPHGLRPGPQNPDVPIRETVTDAQGRFTVEGLPMGAQLVWAWTKDGSADVWAYPVGGNPVVDVTLELEPAGSISGTVRDANGRPVAGARVYPHLRQSAESPLEDGWAGLFAAKTDDSGRFTLDALQAGLWRLYAQAAGHGSQTTPYVPVGAKDVAITLGPVGGLRGTVLYADNGKPAPKVVLRFRCENLPRDVRKTQADSKGRYEIPDLSPGLYTVAVEDDRLIVDGYQEVRVTPARATDLNVPVVAGGSVAGRVSDEATGKGIPDVQISVFPEGGASGTLRFAPQGGRGEAKTDADGHYRVAALPSGSYAVQLDYASSYRPSEPGDERRLVAVRAGYETASTDFVLKKGVRVAGVVRRKDGSPGLGAMVTVEMPGGGRGSSVKADGTFEVDGLSPGKEVYIHAKTDGWVSERMGPLELTEEGLSDVELTLLPATGVVAGKLVTREGRPVPDVYVSVAGDVGNGSDRTGQGGRFRITGLPGGTYKIAARGRVATQGTVSPETVTLAEGEAREDLTLTMGGGLTIAGRVTDTNRKPLPGARVMAEGLGSNMTATTGADGSYTLFVAMPQPYRLYALCDGYGTGTLEAVEAGSDGADFVLAAGGAIEGRVVQAGSGAPVADFEIRTIAAQTGQFTAPLQPFVKTGQPFHDPNGHFRLDNLPEGLVTMEVTAEGFVAQSVSVEVAVQQVSKPADIALSPSPRIEGTVRDMTGRPVGGAAILAGARGLDPPAWPQQPRVAASDPDGRFQVSTLPEGADRIAAAHPDYALAFADIDPTPAKAQRVDLVVEPGATMSGYVSMDGRPVPNAQIQLSYADASGSHALSTNSDGSGYYELRGLTAGNVDVTATVPQPEGQGSMRSPLRSARISPGAAERLDFALASGLGVVEGSVTRAGQPVTPTQVTLLREDGDGTRELCFGTAAEGSYRIENVPAGPATLMVTAYDGESRMQTAPVRVQAGRSTRCDIELAGENAVAGIVDGWRQGMVAEVRLVPGSVPVSGSAWGVVRSLSNMPTSQTSASQPDGAFRFGNRLADGTYTLIVLAMTSEAHERSMYENARVGSVVFNVRGGEEAFVRVPLR